METQELRAELIKKIETADEDELRQLETLINTFEKEEDQFCKDPTLKSLDQIERGELIPHDQVMKETSEKYGLKRKIDLSNPPIEIKDLLEIAQKQVANGQIKTNEEVKELIKNKYGFQIK